MSVRINYKEETRPILSVEGLSYGALKVTASWNSTQIKLVQNSNEIFVSKNDAPEFFEACAKLAKQHV